MSANLCQCELTIAVNNVDGRDWCVHVGWNVQDSSPAVRTGTILELGEEDIESTWSAVKLIFEWLNCLLVDVTTLGSVVVEDANVGECRRKCKLWRCRCRLLLLLLLLLELV